MGPLRIVILLVLLYILYRLVTGPKKRPAGKARPEPAARVTDVLEEDPVCHVCIPRAQAVTMRDGDETIYFCSRECLARYREERKGRRS